MFIFVFIQVEVKYTDASERMPARRLRTPHPNLPADPMSCLTVFEVIPMTFQHHVAVVAFYTRAGDGHHAVSMLTGTAEQQDSYFLQRY